MHPEHYIPAIHASHLAEVCARYGVSRTRLFSGTGVTEAVASDPHARISVVEVERVVGRARALTGEPALGLALGLQMRVSAHGYLGFAAMAASTIGEALTLATKFAPTRTNALSLRLDVADDVAALVITELASFGTARDVVIFALIEGIRQIGRTLTGVALTGRAHVAFEEPAYFAKTASADRKSVRFNQRDNRIVFDARVLTLPLMMADAGALALATEACERELEAIGQRNLFSQRVRASLGRRASGIPSLEEVARTLSVSTRTLKRRLLEEGTTFRDLSDEARRDRAILLLQTTQYSLDTIAERVGYSDVANFTRAVKRWTGATPASLRK